MSPSSYKLEVTKKPRYLTDLVKLSSWQEKQNLGLHIIVTTESFKTFCLEIDYIAIKAYNSQVGLLGIISSQWRLEQKQHTSSANMRWLTFNNIIPT